MRKNKQLKPLRSRWATEEDGVRFHSSHHHVQTDSTDPRSQISASTFLCRYNQTSTFLEKIFSFFPLFLHRAPLTHGGKGNPGCAEEAASYYPVTAVKKNPRGKFLTCWWISTKKSKILQVQVNYSKNKNNETPEDFSSVNLTSWPLTPSWDWAMLKKNRTQANSYPSVRCYRDAFNNPPWCLHCHPCRAF